MKNVLKQLGINATDIGTSTGNKWIKSKGEVLQSFSPVDGKLIASVTSTTEKEYEEVIREAQKAFGVWRNIPAPKRGEIVGRLAMNFALTKNRWAN